MKKKVLTVCLVAVIAIMAVAGASLAYLTDTDEATNTFTLGNVSIELIETTYHREGNDNAGDTQIPDPTAIASGMEIIFFGVLCTNIPMVVDFSVHGKDLFPVGTV